MRKPIIAILALAALLVPAAVIAQVPPPVPALPDAERRTQYTISNQAGPFDVGFAIYGDGSDYGNWIEVWLNGVRLPAVTNWQLTLSSGASIATAARPLTNAQVTLATASTGTLQIVGARRPRRAAQLAENRGVAARDFNQLYTDAIAELRERWDYMQRLIVAPAGEVLSGLPPAATRKGALLGFDGSTGNIPTMYAFPGPGSVAGPAGNVDGQFAVFDGDGNHLRAGTLPPPWTTSFSSPVLNDGAIRIAAGPDGGGNGYFFGPVHYNGIGLWLFDAGQNKWRYGKVSVTHETTPYDVRSTFINGVPGQAIAVQTLYYVYAYFANSGDEFLTLDLSTTGPIGNFTDGLAFRNDGTKVRRWVGILRSRADGQIWKAGSRGVFFNGLASIYNPQVLNYHIQYAAAGLTNGAWAELDSTQYIGAMVMGDLGIEEYVTFSGNVLCSTVPCTVSVGIARGAPTESSAPENPPFDFVDIRIPEANVPFPFAITVSAGDSPSDLRFYRVMGKTTAGTYAIQNGRMAMYLKH